MSVDTELAKILASNSSHMMEVAVTDNNSAMTTARNLSSTQCETPLTIQHKYFPIEHYIYIYYMCPLAIIGIVLNATSLRVFNAKSFSTTVTFKYLRIIARIDLFICIIVLGYCISFYTPVFNRHDLYIRNHYLAYIYIPFANLSINLSMYFNLLVSIERLISVGWPTKKYTYFKPSRFIWSCILVLLGTVIINLYLFFEFKASFCVGIMIREFTYSPWFTIYNFIKEMISRVLPIAILIIANIMLIAIVQSSRNRMKNKSRVQQNNLASSSGGCCQCITNLFKKSDEANGEDAASNKNLIKTAAAKRNRQDNQLTHMTICVAVLYIFCSVPMSMMILLPKLIYKENYGIIANGYDYKVLAAIANSLELLQCSLRFFIYFFFTTQFRIELKKMLLVFNVSNKEQRSEQHLPMEKPAVKAVVKEPNQINEKVETSSLTSK